MRFVASLICAAMLLAAAPAAADDDWSVKRSAFDLREVARYKKMLARNATDGYALSRLATLYRRHRSLDSLIREYRLLARASRKNGGPRFVLGRLNAMAGRWEEAARHFRIAAGLLPASDWPRAGLAAALEKLGKTALALEAYKEALALAKNKARKKKYLAALALLATTSGDHKAAAAHHAALAALEPKRRRHQVDRAHALVRAGQRDEALATLKKLLGRTPDAARRVELLKEVGRLEAALGDLDRAVATFRKAMALTTRDHWLRRELTDEIIGIYRQREQLAELVKELKERWKRPGAFEHEILGKLYDETGDEEKALAAYRSALKRAPHQVQTRLRVIALLERSGQTAAAIKEYRRLVQVAPGEPRHQLTLARRLYADGDQKKAVAQLVRCGRRFPGDPSVQSVLADLYSRWGEKERALTASRAMVRIEPREPAHIINLGEQYFLDGKKKKAMATWARLLRIIPRRHAALARLAEVYAQHNLPDRARTLFARAIKLEPKIIAYHRGLALLWEVKRHTSKAVAAWEQVRTLGQAAGGAAGRQAEREGRGHIIKLLHRSFQLRRTLRVLSHKLDRGLLSQPDSLLLAEGLLRLGSPKPAARVYRLVLAKDPDNAEVLLALEKVYLRQRKLEDALAVLKKLVKVQPTAAREYYQRMADLLLQLYRDKEALEYAHKAVKVGARDAASLERLGRLLENKEDYKGAADAYRQAIARDPAHVPAYFALARLMSRGGDPAGADAMYRQIIGRASDPEQVRRAFRLGVTAATYAGTLAELEKELLPRAQRGVHRDVFRELLIKVYLRSAPPLIHHARRGTPAARLEARAALKRMGKRGLSLLLEELAADRWGSREGLVRILGYMGNPNAALPLLRIAAEEEEVVFVVRGRAPRSLRKILWSRSSSGYGGWSRSSRRSNLRVAAAAAAGRIASPRAVPGLLKLLGSRQGPMRDVAAWALARAGDRRAVKALLAALGDRRVAVQAAACAGLGAARDLTMRPVLEEVMADEDRAEEVRAACAWGLGALGDAAALPRLAAALGRGDGEQQRCAAWAMGRLGDSRAVAPLLESLWLRRSRVRDATLWSLGRLGRGAPDSPPPPPAVPDILLRDGRVDLAEFIRRLTEEVDDGQDSGRLAAPVPAALLEAHAGAVARGLIRGLERHSDMALGVLEALDGSPAGLTLGPLTAGEGELDGAARTRLAEVVGRACAPLEPHLIRAAGHRDAGVRAAALRVLAKLSPRRAARGALLKDALADAAWQVGVAALQAAEISHARGALPRPRAVTLAGAALANQSWQVRERAARLLGALPEAGGPAGARLLVQAATRDTDGFVRAAACLALGAPGGVRDPAARAACGTPAPPSR